MKLKKLAAIMGLGLGLAVAAAPASAALYSFEDDDIDFILRANDAGAYVPIQSGTLSAGDIFFAVFEIPIFTIDGNNAIPAGQELTGVAAVELLRIIGTGAGAQYIFGVSGAPIDSFAGYAGPDLPDGAAIAMFFNGTSGDPTDPTADRDLDLNRTTNPATNCTSFSDCLTQATLGDLFQVDGFGLDPDEFWAATQILAGGGDIATVLGSNNNLLISAFNAGLSNFYQDGATIGFINVATGLDCGNPGYVADGCVQISVSGTVTGGQGLSNGAVAHSDFDAQKFTTVPEPASLALLGIGLMGLGATMRRRRS